MWILIPGRHHLLTQFQFRYLFRLCSGGLANEKDLDGRPVPPVDRVEGVVFAVTSANHSNTRRNPIPFYLRAMAIQEFADPLPVPALVYGVDDVGHIADFASYTLKSLRHQSEGLCDLRPDNTVVVCSTPVLENYEKLGFQILPSELEGRGYRQYRESLPWEIVERIAQLGAGWLKEPWVLERIHPASYRLWTDYRLGEKTALIFSDAMIGDDGDITGTRSYNVYVRQMDEIAGLKFAETRPFIQPGRIGDIGCAVGSWLALASAEPALRESDFFGVEIARPLYEICLQRKQNGEFVNPSLFFTRKNAVTGLVFEPGTMNTIHTSSLTHEIESYSGREDLLSFIRNRLEELAIGGVWINRDVIGPEEKDRPVALWLAADDGEMGAPFECAGVSDVKARLDRLSTRARFLQFARDFRRKEGGTMAYETVEREGDTYFLLPLGAACEFLYKKDYTDNWQSEMHETFCFWDYAQWTKAMEAAGFTLHPASHAYRNEWLVSHRFCGKARLFDPSCEPWAPLDFPVTHMLLMGVSKGTCGSM